MVVKTKLDFTREDRIRIAKLYNSKEELASPDLLEQYIQDLFRNSIEHLKAK